MSAVLCGFRTGFTQVCQFRKIHMYKAIPLSQRWVFTQPQSLHNSYNDLYIYLNSLAVLEDMGPGMRPCINSQKKEFPPTQPQYYSAD